MSPRLPTVIAATLLAGAATAHAQSWTDATSSTIGTTAQWTNKVTVADLDGDGRVDVLFANGGDYDTAGTPEPQRAFRNTGDFDGPGNAFTEYSTTLFGAGGTRLARVIVARDLDDDGDVDVFVPGAHGTASALFVNDLDGTAAWIDASANLPAGDLYAGDAEAGDVDGDGDLDLVIADWGGPPFSPSTDGGQTRVWLNDGAATFTDATAARMPVDLVEMSWDLELVDVDDDGDLDVLVSCKLCTGGRLYDNDGAGTFAATTGRLPQATNNYEYEPMDLDGDGDLDLMTINDGGSLKETVLFNDDGSFSDVTASSLPAGLNLANSDDNVIAYLDADSDGDADALIGSLNAADRLLRNNGMGVLSLDDDVITLNTPGTLGIALADFNGDGRLDIVMGQGEVTSSDKLLLANGAIAADNLAPSVRFVRPARPGDLLVVARAHDRKSPSFAHDWRRVEIELIPGGGGTSRNVTMTWRGEYLWAAELPADAEEDPTLTYRVCATDAAGNVGCSIPRRIDQADPVDAGPDDVDAGDAPDAGDPAVEDPDGGCCSSSPDPAGTVALLLVVACAIVPRASRREVRR